MIMDGRRTVILADDHLMVRQAIRTMLEREGFSVVGEASNGHEAIRLARQLRPMVAILDYGMPLLNGIDAAVEIQKQAPQTQVVMLTMYDDDTQALEALKNGIRGYVLKTQASPDLVTALQEVMLGEVYLSPRISGTVVRSLVSGHELPDELLTSRERQVLQLIAEGRTTKEIAGLLNVSVKTAESHRSHIMQRLDMHNIAGLVRYAIKRGMIDP